MAIPATLRVGARGSDLSRAQTRWVIERLGAAHPGLVCELVAIETAGDRDQTSALDAIWPPGGFVREIERALLEGEIDLAVHSMKDLPTEPVPGLVVAAVPERAAPHDLLLTREAGVVSPRASMRAMLMSLPAGFRVGSSSPRRTYQLLTRAPQVRVEPIRGNVPTRIQKMQDGQFDGIVLAAAGLERLGIVYPHAIPLEMADFPPAPGQGALAVQTREDGASRGLVAAIDHASTRAAVTAERSFLRGCGGGCRAALGALARVTDKGLTLYGQFFAEAPDGHSARCFHGVIAGGVAEAEEIGHQLARQILEKTGA